MAKKSRKRAKKSEFEYDVAISYAWEDKKIAAKIVRSLEKRGLNVFFDQNKVSSLWGKDKSEFERIYSSGSRYVIPLISESYISKRWCQIEFAAAKAEAKTRAIEFILPVRLDGARQRGLTLDTIYIDVKSHSVEAIARIFVEKLNRLGSQNLLQEAGRSKSESAPELLVLSAERRHNLGILSLSICPLVDGYFESIFPKVNWNAELKYFRKHNLVVRLKYAWKIPRKICRVFEQDEEEFAKITDEWIRALLPYSGHPDTALALSLHLLQADRNESALSILADNAIALDPGFWNSLYLETIESLKPLFRSRSLLPATKAKLRNALGVCLCRDGRNRVDITVFSELRRYAYRSGDKWALDHSFINAGVAQYQLGDLISAKRTYEKSIKCARLSGDETILARSMNNLAQLLIGSEPKRAGTLMKESLTIKKRMGDEQGIVSAFLALGNLSIRLKNLKKARLWYIRAQKKARKHDLRFEQSISLLNWGRVESSFENFDEALTLYRSAQKIAREESYNYPMALSLNNQANLYFRLGKTGKAKLCLEELASLYERTGDVNGRVSAILDIGLVLVNANKTKESRKVLLQARKLARKVNSDDLLHSCYLTYALSYSIEGNVRKCCRSLESSAKSLSKSAYLSAELLVSAAEFARENPNSHIEPRGYYRKALGFLVDCEKSDLVVLSLKAICYEELGDNEAAIKLWHAFSSRANRSADVMSEFNATIQLARIALSVRDFASLEMCLKKAEPLVMDVRQEVSLLAFRVDLLLECEKQRESEKTFQRAVRLCRKHGFSAECVDLHMKFGYYYLTKGKRLQYAGFKAYVVGLSESISVGENVFLGVGSHIVSVLYAVQAKQGSDRIICLQERLYAWLQKSVSSSDEESIIKWLLWPFRVTLILSEVHPPESITELQIRRAMETEMRSW